METKKKNTKDEEIARLRAELSVEREAKELTLQNELGNLQDMSNASSLNAMPFRETGHKTVYLYKELGDRIGPFHPDNAADIMRRWAKKGFRLYTKPRTEQQIADVKNSERYKKYKKEREEERKKIRAYGKNRNKIAEEIAKETGRSIVNELVNAKAINR